jgi:phosphatidylserine/phosphatidylglycerophosphate/cardiolipin synthase-like enzyme
VGSANFTWGGLYANYEVGLLVEGDIAWKLAEIVDSLANLP